MSDSSDPAQQLFDKINGNFWEMYWNNSKIKPTIFNRTRRKKLIKESQGVLEILTLLESNYNSFFRKHGLAGDVIILTNDSSVIIDKFEEYGINYITTRDVVIGKVLSAYFALKKFDRVHNVLRSIIKDGKKYYPSGGYQPLTTSHITFLMSNIEELLHIAVIKSIDSLKSKCIILIKELNEMVIQTKNTSILQADEHINLGTILYALKNKKYITFLVGLVKSGLLLIDDYISYQIFKEYWLQDFKQYQYNKKYALKLIDEGDSIKAIELLNVAESINPFVRYDGDLFYYRGVAYLKDGNELLAHYDWKRAYDLGSFQLKYSMEEFGVSIEDIEKSIAEKRDS